MSDFLRNIQKFVNRDRLERALVILYTRFDRWFSTFSIDESTKSSIYIGLTIGVCVVTFLAFFPGEPTADYETSTEEEALSAVKRKLYKKKKVPVEDEVQSPVSEGSKQKKNDNQMAGKKENAKQHSAQSSKSPVSSEILRRMEKFEEIKKDRETEMDQEAEAFLEEMKSKGVSEDKLREMVPEYLSAQELKENSRKPLVVTLLNWSIPLALLYGMFWVLQRDFGVTPFSIFKHFFSTRSSRIFIYFRWSAWGWRNRSF